MAEAEGSMERALTTLWIDPYRDVDGIWLRGSFHGHCREGSGCSSVPLAEGVRRYREAGADFVTLTDHDRVTELADVAREHPGLVFLEGFEHSRAEHLLFVGELVDALHELPPPEAMSRAGGLLTILAHPEPEGRPYWTLEKILALGRRPDGLEVYDGHYGIERMLAMGRRPLYTHVWDALLTAGLRLWGFADDDFHDPADFGNAFNMVCAAERTPRAVVEAARRGRCYGSTGLLLDAVGWSDGRIDVATAGPATGRFVGPGGIVLQESSGRRFAFRPGGEAYVRFEAEGPAGRLFLQPMFREDYGRPKPLAERAAFGEDDGDGYG